MSNLWVWLRKNKDKILNLLLYLLVFVSVVYPYADKDWGWHYKYGEYFFEHGKILYDNPFSWTLPDYQWVNHSWLFDPLLYGFTKLFGFGGLTFIGGAVGLVIFAVLLSPFKLTFWKKAVLGTTFVFMTEIGLSNGLRSQTIGLLLVAILMQIFIRARDKPEVLKWLPPLFLLWANMHGDFTFGLVLCALFVGTLMLTKYLKQKTLNLSLLRIYIWPVFLAFLATFINPFTYKPHLESFNHLSNPYLRSIVEWQPMFRDCSSCQPRLFVLYVLILLVGYIYCLKTKKLWALPYAVFGVLFLYSTVQTRRFAPLFCIVTLPFLAELLQNMKWKFEKSSKAAILAVLFLLGGFHANLVNRFPSQHLYNYTEADYCYFASGCSLTIIPYLNQHPPTGRGFNFYDWGGYFIGKGFEQKLFVDGRMHVWEQDGYQPFGDYDEIMYYENYGLFYAYDFDWAIIGSNSLLAHKLYYTEDLGKWRLDYQDGYTSYYVRVR